jgi:hypothetical protein
MDIYSVNGNVKNLLLVNGTHVINGAWDLEKRQGKEGYFIPHTDTPVKFEMTITPDRHKEDGPDGRWYKKGWIDYNTTLDRAEKILLTKNEKQSNI